MATITVNGTLIYDDGTSTPLHIQITDKGADVATLQKVFHTQSVGTTAGGEAVVLGECTAPGWFMAINRDETNYVEVLAAVSGTVIGKMLAGESYGPVRLGSGAQVPAMLANTAAVKVDYLLIQT